MNFHLVTPQKLDVSKDSMSGLSDLLCSLLPDAENQLSTAHRYLTLLTCPVATVSEGHLDDA
jgi:hypothetical protein